MKPSILRRNLWALNAAECVTLVFFLFFLLLSLAALLTRQPGALTPLVKSLVQALFWAAYLALVANRLPPPWGAWGFIRSLMPYLALSLQYDLMGSLVPVVHRSTHDAALLSLDAASGSRGAAFWRALQTSWTGDFFSLFYLSLFVWLFALMVFLARARRPLYPRFLTGLILVYSAGFLGYLLFPAIGPRYAYASDWAWLSGGPVKRFCDSVVALLGARFDVFPSLHAALSSYLCFWQARHDRRSLAWALPLALAIQVSCLALGFHYLPDLLSGVLVAGASAWAAPRLEAFFARLRDALSPPLLWLEELSEGEGERFGRLAGRLSLMKPVGGRLADGFLWTGEVRTHVSDVLKSALSDLGEGPYWLRPSDGSGLQRGTLTGLKPMDAEKVEKALLHDAKRRPFVVQQALKVTALGLTRCLPPQWRRPGGVELRMTSLPVGRVTLHRLETSPIAGVFEVPWDYYPVDFPVRGWELFDVAQLTRHLARKWGEFTEVEWVLSEGRVYVLDGRPVKMTPATSEPE